MTTIKIFLQKEHRQGEGEKHARNIAVSKAHFYSWVKRDATYLLLATSHRGFPFIFTRCSGSMRSVHDATWKTSCVPAVITELLNTN